MEELEFETAVKKGKALVEEGRKTNDDFGNRIKFVRDLVGNADNLDSIQRLQSQKQSLRDDLKKLNSAYRTARSNELDVIDDKWAEKRDEMQADISQSLTSLVIASNNFAKDKLKLNQLPETLGENLSEMNQMLTELESQADKYSEVEGLGLTDGQQDVVDNIRSKYSELKQTLKTHDELAESLGSAKSHQALFSALEKIVGSGLTESKHYKAAEAILPSSSFFENLEGKTFMPGAPGSWGSAIDSISRSLRPRELVAEEKSLLDQLYDEARIKSVFATVFLALQ